MSSDWFETPIACFVTFRTFGTWLHGDDRFSVDRRHNTYGSPRIAPNPSWKRFEARAVARDPVILNSHQRRVVDASIRDTCDVRGWRLYARNVRTNHIHAVIGTSVSASRVVVALKANATRWMREDGCWTSQASPWSKGSSKRYVWTVAQLERAVAYVLEGQGPSLDDQSRER